MMSSITIIKKPKITNLKKGIPDEVLEEIVGLDINLGHNIGAISIGFDFNLSNDIFKNHNAWAVSINSFYHHALIVCPEKTKLAEWFKKQFPGYPKIPYSNMVILISKDCCKYNA